jgi:hypothetical protein
MSVSELAMAVICCYLEGLGILKGDVLIINEL